MVESILNDFRARQQGRNRPIPRLQAAVDVGLCLAGAPPPDAGGAFDWGLLLFAAIFFGILLSAARGAWARRRQLAAARAALEKMRAEQAAAEESARYPSTSCPVCLEDFAPGGEGGGGGGEGDALLPPTTPFPTTRPLALACGHAFCEPCITRWLARHDTCPICRAPVGPERGAGAAAPPTTTPPPSRRPYDAGAYRDELVFRLGSLARLYPAVVTAEVLAGWASSARAGCPLPAWADVRAAELADASSAARRRREGGLGAVGGFGGGSAAGATGGGSSW
jgi:hypothetical protein